MGLKPVEPTASHPLQITSENEFSSQVIQVELYSLHTWAQDQFGLQVGKADFSAHFCYTAVALQSHGFDLVFGYLKVSFFLIVHSRIFDYRVDEKTIALQPVDGALQISVPPQFLRKFVLLGIIQEGAEQYVSVRFLSNKEGCIWESCCVFDVGLFCFSDPLAEDVAEPYYPWSLLLLAVFYLREEVVFVRFSYSVYLAENIVDEPVDPLGGNDRWLSRL